MVGFGSSGWDTFKEDEFLKKKIFKLLLEIGFPSDPSSEDLNYVGKP